MIKILGFEIEIFDFILLIFSCLCFVTGLLNLCVYGAYTSLDGPVYVRNQFIGLWLGGVIVFFFSIQSIYLLFKNEKEFMKKSFYFNLVYFSIGLVCSFILIICYGLSLKADAIIWSILIFIICMLNLYILVKRRKNKVNSDSIELKDDKDVLKNDQLSRSRSVNCGFETLRIINLILKLIVLIFLGFLVAGSVIIGGLTLKYRPRGKIVDVTLSDGSGRSLKIHFKCDGPKNDSFPVFMFEGSGSHGMADYLGLQMVLTSSGKRSCIWDKPGLGYSDYLYTDMKNSSLYYHNFMKAMNEKPPFIFVGWGGGGPTVYNYAYTNPEMVHSLTFLDVAPNGIEWTIPKILKNFTQTQYNNYVDKDIDSRMSLFGIINGLGVPWGIMTFFVPLGNSYPVELREELRWYFQTDKTWVTQRFFLKNMKNTVDVFSTQQLTKNITLYHINTVHDDDQVKILICDKQKLDSEKCDYQKSYNRLLIDFRQKMLNFTKIINCTTDDCDLGYYIFNGPQYTVTNLLEIYKNDVIK